MQFGWAGQGAGKRLAAGVLDADVTLRSAKTEQLEQAFRNVALTLSD